MLKCKDVTERANAYIDGDLNAWARMQMRMHLMMCEHCTRFMAQMRQTKALLRQSVHAGEQAPVDPRVFAAFRQTRDPEGQ